MPEPTKTRHLLPEPTKPSRGLLDTSVLIDIGSVDPTRLPVEVAISAITLAELAAGPHAAQDPYERARRQEHVQRAEAAFNPVPFGVTCARAFGLVFAAVTASGRKARGARMVDLLIAATALAEELPLYTRNIGNFGGLEHLLDVIEV